MTSVWRKLGVLLWVFAISAGAWSAGCRDESAAGGECSTDNATALYRRKIEPILRDDRPASCTQCHLPGIDLSLFVQDTPCQTMACLADLGLVDFAEPERSTVLSWIDRAKPESSLITEQVISQEYDGMLEWIRYSASCGSQACGTFTDPCNEKLPGASTRCDVTVTVGGEFTDAGDCSELALEQLFSSNVYQWRERCYPCHFRSDIQVPEAPKWISDANMQKVETTTACASASLETMRTVLGRGYVDLQQPARSLILLKPLAAEGGGVAHGGGPKFDGPDDPSYQTFLAWIRRYADCSAEDPTLPQAAPAPTTSTPITGGGSNSSIYDYCNCMLFNCHDLSHAVWGESDEALLAGCRSSAIDLPVHGMPIMTGNFLECRAAHCEQGRQDPDACSAAMGQTVCL
ncbi:MAG TPA: hypothetical protein VJV78_26740 [Polyangiales bacterium]|nr:hypothetical protein [Polyangiales bacterium]